MKNFVTGALLVSGILSSNQLAAEKGSLLSIDSLHKQIEIGNLLVDKKQYNLLSSNTADSIVHVFVTHDEVIGSLDYYINDYHDRLCFADTSEVIMHTGRMFPYDMLDFGDQDQIFREDTKVTTTVQIEGDESSKYTRMPFDYTAELPQKDLDEVERYVLRENRGSQSYKQAKAKVLENHTRLSNVDTIDEEQIFWMLGDLELHKKIFLEKLCEKLNIAETKFPRRDFSFAHFGDDIENTYKQHLLEDIQISRNDEIAALYGSELYTYCKSIDSKAAHAREQTRGPRNTDTIQHDATNKLNTLRDVSVNKLHYLSDQERDTEYKQSVYKRASQEYVHRQNRLLNMMLVKDEQEVAKTKSILQTLSNTMNNPAVAVKITEGNNENAAVYDIDSSRLWFFRVTLANIVENTFVSEMQKLQKHNLSFENFRTSFGDKIRNNLFVSDLKKIIKQFPQDKTSIEELIQEKFDRDKDIYQDRYTHILETGKDPGRHMRRGM